MTRESVFQTFFVDHRYCFIDLKEKMYWRGAGWAKVNYRYIRVDYPGAEYLY